MFYARALSPTFPVSNNPHMVSPLLSGTCSASLPPPSVWRSSLASPSVFPARRPHRRQLRKERRREKKHRSEEEEAGDDREHALIDIWTGFSRGHVEGLLPLRYQTFRPRKNKDIEYWTSHFCIIKKDKEEAS